MLVQQIAGFSLAMLAMVLYSLYMVPRKQISVSQQVFAWWMGLGILIGTTLIGFLFDGFQRITTFQYTLIFASGLVWATGSVGYSTAVSYIGLSRSTPIKNTSAILGTLAGVVVFREFTLSRFFPFMLALLGSAAIVASTMILGRIEAPKGAMEHRPDRKRLVFGVLASLWAAVAYSVYTIPMKIVYAQGIGPSAFLFYMGQGCFVGMALIALWGKPWAITEEPITWRERSLAQLSGAMWAVGSLCANYAVKWIGVAVTWPLTKTTAFAVLYGVFILKEADLVKHRRDLQIGLALSIIGIILLPLAIGHN